MFFFQAKRIYGYTSATHTKKLGVLTFVSARLNWHFNEKAAKGAASAEKVIGGLPLVIKKTLF